MTERSFDSKIDRLIVELKKKNCVVLCGAGISCAAGIPDFRYLKIEKYKALFFF